MFLCHSLILITSHTLHFNSRYRLSYCVIIHVLRTLHLSSTSANMSDVIHSLFWQPRLTLTVNDFLAVWSIWLP